MAPSNNAIPSTTSGGEVTMAAALARLGLRPVKLVRVQFCPFEKNVESTRYGFWGGGRRPRSRRLRAHPRPPARVPRPLRPALPASRTPLRPRARSRGPPAAGPFSRR